MPRSEKFGNLGPYPEGASFPKLLQWHLDNGTRPHIKPGERGEVWTQAEFSREFPVPEKKGKKVVEDRDNPARNVSNWVRGKNQPSADHLEHIKYALFGDKPAYQAWRDDLGNAYRVWPHARTLVGQIPPPPPHFMGRDADVAALLNALLAPESARAILVRGGPGIGKSSLTRAVGNHKEIVERFGEAYRWFVELDTASTAIAMEDAIGRAIGSDPSKGFKATLAVLRHRPGLVVLDNLETPWDPPGERAKTEAAIAALTAIPGVAVLASFRGGRQPFRSVNWTLVHPVDRLNPPFDRELFQRTAANNFDGDPRLDDFLKALDGIPLAIELVALRAHGRSSLGALWQQWRQLGVELAADPDYASSPDRLTSLPHSIELSLCSSRMTETALRLFRYLGQLPAGLVDEDRDALLGENADGFNARDALVRIGLAIERNDRLDLLSPVREHALRRHMPAHADQAKWPEHYLRLTQSLGERIGTSEGGRAMARLVPEFANIEAAFRALLESGRRHDAMKALKGFGRLTYLGSLPTMVLGELAQASILGHDVLGEANCIKGLADIALARTDYKTARNAYEHALGLYRNVSDVLGQANCLFLLGEIVRAHGDQSAAIKAYDEALPLYRQSGDLIGEANCIRSLGNVALARMDREGAHQAYHDALPLYRRAEYVVGEANCTLSLGGLALERGDHKSAREACEIALELYTKAGSVVGEANSIMRLGEIALQSSDLERASQAFTEAVSLYRTAGELRGQANCAFSFGEIARGKSDLHAASKAFWEALPLYRTVGDLFGEANCIRSLGDIAASCEDLETAERNYEEARSLYHQAGFDRGEAKCIDCLGDIALARGDHKGAHKAYEEAIQLYSKAGDFKGADECRKLLQGLPKQ